MSDPHLFGVIMAGGSGTRFWPASRKKRPKQFLPIAGERPMIAETLGRLEGLIPPDRVLVVTAQDQVPLVREAVPAIPHANVLAEPAARNTAPCIAFAVRETLRRDPEAIQVVLPSDHVISPVEAFQETLRAGVEEAASSDVLVTFGIRPDHPATGYGYIETGPETGRRRDIPVLEVQRFVEKPDLTRAREFLASGRFLWNSGMFVWKASAILAALETYVPEIPRGFRRVDEGADLAEVYTALPSVPIDIGVMERAPNVRVLPIDYRWSDVGSWAALHELLEPDASGNRSVLPGGGLLVAEDTRDCLVYAEGEEAVALVGVRDLVVVRAPGATLVCPVDRAQDVRRIVERLVREGRQFL